MYKRENESSKVEEGVLENVTIRSIIIGLILVAAICGVSAYSDYWVNNTWLAAHHFPIVAVFLLTILVLVINVILQITKYISPLTYGELITIWCMMIVTASLPTLGLAAYLLPTLVGLNYFSTPENEWNELFIKNIPDWLVVKEERAVNYFYESLPYGSPVPWQSWIKPILFWATFTFILWFVMACLSTIFRKQWVEKEKFVFPLVQLPRELAKPPENSNLVNSFLKNKIMWFAFMVPVIIHTISTLHFYFPAVPIIPIRFHTWHIFSDKPWREVLPLDFNLQFSTVGLTYLMSLEVSFSLWFFYIFYKIERIFGSMAGVSSALYYRGFERYREMGAYIVLFAFFIFAARTHFKHIIKATLSKGSSVDSDENEPLPYRISIIGLIFGLLALTFLLILAGATSFWLIFGIISFFAIVCVIDAWIVTRGLFFIHGAFKAPDLFVSALGTTRLGHSNLTIIAFPKRVFFRDRREILMPHLVNSFKIADFPKLKRRQLHIAIWIALFLGLIISCYSYLHLAYHKGASNLGRRWIHVWSPQEPFRELAGFLTNPQDTDWQSMGFVLTGGAIMSVLLFMRNRFLWWPLHPIGFITVGQFPLNNIWFSIFLGWLIKYILLKQGGLKIYRRARPFFMGLILGESCIAGIWAIVGLFTKKGFNFLYF